MKFKIDKEENFDNEQAIAEYKKTGDEELKNKIIEQNLRLVIHNAAKFNHPAQLELDDLIDVGVIGLIKSIDKYNPTSGNKFSTYAGRTIDNHIIEYIGEWHADGKHHFAEPFRKYIAIATSTFGKDYKECSEEEVDYVLNLMLEKKIIDTDKKYKTLRGMVLCKKILDSDIEEVENVAVENEEEFDRTEFIMKHREELYSVLTDEEIELIELIYTIGYTEVELTGKYNMTFQGVNNKKMKALKKMRRIANKYL